jgi:radical SAM protein with 4Fe4S-binding SPASM domain
MKNDKRIKFLDLNIKRKSFLSDKNLFFFKNSKIPMPSVIEISNSGMCNRKCSFCPRSDPKYKDINEFIDEKLHQKIFDELFLYDYSGTVLYSGYVEPLLHKRIYKDIEYVRNRLPNVNIELVTNGDVLNNKRILKLYEAGLNMLLISVYDGPDEARNFESMMEGLKISKEKYVIRNRYYGEDKDFGITLSNRAGNLINSKYKILPPKQPLKLKCNYPSYNFFIDYNGDVQMCSHDWGKKMIMGNINLNSIREIWTSKKFDLIRKRLNNSDRNFSPCNLCDVKGDLIGNKHSKYWDEFYESKEK